jgi:hypothetical protein
MSIPKTIPVQKVLTDPVTKKYILAEQFFPKSQALRKRKQTAVCNLDDPGVQVYVFDNSADPASPYPPTPPHIFLQFLRKHGSDPCQGQISPVFAMSTAMHARYVIAVCRVEDSEIFNCPGDRKGFFDLEQSVEELTARDVYNYAKAQLWSALPDESNWPWQSTPRAAYEFTIDELAEKCSFPFLCSYTTLFVEPNMSPDSDTSASLYRADPDGTIHRRATPTDTATVPELARYAVPLDNGIIYIPGSNFGTGLFMSGSLKVPFAAKDADGSITAEVAIDDLAVKVTSQSFLSNLPPPSERTPLILRALSAIAEAGGAALAPDAAFVEVSCSCRDAGVHVEYLKMYICTWLAMFHEKRQLQLCAATYPAFASWRRYGFTQRENDCCADSPEVRLTKTGKYPGMHRMTRCIGRPTTEAGGGCVPESDSLLKHLTKSMGGSGGAAGQQQVRTPPVMMRGSKQLAADVAKFREVLSAYDPSRSALGAFQDSATAEATDYSDKFGFTGPDVGAFCAAQNEDAFGEELEEDLEVFDTIENKRKQVQDLERKRDAASTAKKPGFDAKITALRAGGAPAAAPKTHAAMHNTSRSLHNYLASLNKGKSTSPIPDDEYHKQRANRSKTLENAMGHLSDAAGAAAREAYASREDTPFTEEGRTTRSSPARGPAQPIDIPPPSTRSPPARGPVPPPPPRPPPARGPVLPAAIPPPPTAMAQRRQRDPEYTVLPPARRQRI